MNAGSDRSGDALLRRRRAVLVADLVGSVAMMEADEAGAVGQWRAFLGAVTSVILPAHGGRLVKSLGDGILAEFPDGARGVACAFALHRDLAERSAPAASMRIRVGIHVADIYVEDYDVFGDGVNVAARLAELAGNSGGTIVSAETRDQITSGLDAAVEDLGEQRLRNRRRAVRAFRVWPTVEPQSGTVPLARAHGRPSIAVVPFRVMSAEAGHEYLGDGLAEETISALSRVADFFVVSRLSSMAFKDRNVGIRHIGDLLNVQYVLSGSLRSSGSRAVLLAELADARDGQVLWAERFEGDLLDMFAAQAGLARSVVRRVAPFVRSRELRNARVRSLGDLDAFGLVLRGIELMHRASRRDFIDARRALEHAIARDPTAPAAYAWLAKWYVLRVAYGASDDVAGDSATASELTNAALALDADDALALSVDALVSAWLRRDLDTAELRLARAIADNSSEPLAWLLDGATQAWRGNGARAVQSVERALSLSPLDPLKYFFCAVASTANLVAARYPRAIDLASESLRENQSHTPALRALAIGAQLSGDHAGARRAVERLRELEPALTVGQFAERYPGRDSPQARRFASALKAAGLPA